MQIFMHKLDNVERTQFNLLSEEKLTLDTIYDDAEVSLANKDCVPFLKRLKEKRDKARCEYYGFCNYLVINGKAVK